MIEQVTKNGITYEVETTCGSISQLNTLGKNLSRIVLFDERNKTRNVRYLFLDIGLKSISNFLDINGPVVLKEITQTTQRKPDSMFYQYFYDGKNFYVVGIEESFKQDQLKRISLIEASL